MDQSSAVADQARRLSPQRAWPLGHGIWVLADLACRGRLAGDSSAPDAGGTWGLLLATPDLGNEEI